MLYYNISDILKCNFIGKNYRIRSNTKKYPVKIKVKTDKKKNNFVNVLNKLHLMFPDIYEKSEKENPDYLMNNNRGNFLVWYIDGEDNITDKYNLEKYSIYTINDLDDENYLYISKPVHPYIGSGKFIEIGSKEKLEKRDKILFKDQYLQFIIQPLISRKLILWNNEFKFDIRLYSVIYITKNKIKYYNHPYGVARLSLNRYDPINNYESVITNISIQERLDGYSKEKTLKLIRDDLRLGEAIMQDIKNKNLFTIDKRKENQILILGLDVLLLNDESFRLIEINKDPYISIIPDEKNMESIACQSLIRKIFGEIIPEMKTK